ncbi:MAG: transglycosylase domain-containing protein [Bacteroidales bacterium]|nr:transglycosylase domain-containing protein [Bacteroidales bacterium]
MAKSSSSKTKKEVSKSSVLSRILWAVWIAFITVVLLLTLLFTRIAQGKLGYMPPIEELENPKNKYATEIYSSDGVLLSTYYVDEGNRVQVEYKDLSPHLVRALIATEDLRYTRHSGIDVKALFRVFFKRVILQQQTAGGGSTITQQLAKQLYTPPAQSRLERAMQKPIEWVIAVQLERFYTKEEILAMYLNKFDFRYHAVGIKTASWVYFATTPDKLNMEQ